MGSDERDDRRWLDEVHALVAEALQGCEARVWLFGSRARRDHRPGSDVDVAILPVGALPSRVLPLLRERLERSNIPLRVEVVDLSTASTDLRRHVVKEGLPWSVAKSA